MELGDLFRAKITYDAKDKKQRSIIRRFNLVQLGIAFLILSAFTLLTTIILYFLVDSTSRHIFWGFLARAILLDVAFVSLLALLILPTLGSRSVQVQFREHDFLVTVTGGYDKREYAIQYADVERIYIDKLSQSSLWQKIGQGYLIWYENRVEVLNGETITYSKKQRKQFPMVYSLEEVNAILSIVNQCRSKE